MYQRWKAEKRKRKKKKASLHFQLNDSFVWFRPGVNNSFQPSFPFLLSRTYVAHPEREKKEGFSEKCCVSNWIESDYTSYNLWYYDGHRHWVHPRRAVQCVGGKHATRVLHVQADPTDPFTFLEPQYQDISIFYEVQERRAMDLEAQNFWMVRSGRDRRADLRQRDSWQSKRLPRHLASSVLHYQGYKNACRRNLLKAD